ncbi:MULTISPECIES: methionine/alanine import family NSS transporter small subunit [Bacillaceae]|nr:MULTISPECIES: methionine/alanine import family NSS transporter small subunit [Bacillaceae]QNG60578.1 methionine/alanine import family NSS transporter small subunit [Bacillus sp. PAMC26568]
MSGGAITMMVVGMIVIWGGLAASIAHAVIQAKKS